MYQFHQMKAKYHHDDDKKPTEQKFASEAMNSIETAGKRTLDEQVSLGCLLKLGN